MAIKTNIEVNGTKYYRVTKTIGYKSDGSQVQKQFYGRTKSEAELKAQEYMNKIKNGIIETEKNLDSLMNYWLFNIKKYDNIKPSTFESYEATYRLYIKTNEMSLLKLDNIKPIYLQDCYIKMSKNGISGAKIKKIHKLLYQFFNYCINEGYILRNPCENIVIPKDQNSLKENIEYYTEKEVKLIKQKIKGNELELLVLFALGTGLRQGELLALRYSDIDFKNSQLTVNRTVKISTIFEDEKTKNRKQLFQEPKTKNSKRIVDIPPNLLRMLPKKKTNELVFTDNGHVWDARKIYRHWNYFLKENNLPIKKFHSLRHTYATLLLTKGVELITVSKLLGHSSVQITEIYSHVVPKLKKNAVNKINNLF